ncbi:MAG: hypothetical protein A2X34_08395 [Elusimicrobia bacterium GWC2_51_8]|nr:MAG: hypothetical protein A2X33_11560 [Elusimicrobia bacterium GWA2_51_34]OGR63185.1 MAG: hypothetical protein A2X34_08395 [Elusimicrobia bacterium GWC2_51_8]OGR85967.1 MAG: hypothetical protein A2021_03510 [Elusimicrobia bacterium GWF2_52_66]HAF96640.1 hypothetical protein [Elusimicrobiota bacterium]HCE97309.1 hypothetical protein [Elusimicrobiota bacterium]
MRGYAAFAVAIFLLFYAGPKGHTAPDEAISASEFMERFTSMLDSMPAPPAISEPEVIDLEEDDPETYIFINNAKSRPPEPVYLGGDGRLALNRQNSGEQIISYYRNKDGTYNQDEINKINRIMRCSLTGKETPVSIKLIEILDAIEDRFGKREIILLSGYRTPKLNKWVPGAARRSLHMLGWAADIRVQGYSPAKVAAYARKIHAGGVGYYPDAAFTHLDAGRPRHWLVRRPSNTQATGTP